MCEENLCPVEHPRIMVYSMDVICRGNVRNLNEVLPFYEENRLDFIVYDLVNFAGRVLANRWNIPVAQISPQIAFDESALSSQVGNNDYREWIRQQGREAEAFSAGMKSPPVIFCFTGKN